MFDRLGSAVAQRPSIVVLVWVMVAVSLWAAAPRWNAVALDGDLAHLPADAASVQGDALLKRAFSGTRSKSQLVLVVARRDGPLGRHDFKLAEDIAQIFEQRMAEHEAVAGEGLPIVDVWTKDTEFVGKMLKSGDGRAVLVLVQLDQEFMAVDNIRVLEEAREIIDTLGPEVPEGVSIGITGSGAIGADMLESAAESIARVDWVALLLVGVILLVVYRAPLLLVVPLVTIFTTVFVATHTIAILTQFNSLLGWDWWHFRIFKTTRIFLVVILYGAGTDYCLFLIARYKEELCNGLARAEAVRAALAGVGSALVGSALTTVVGLALMFFADYGKFSNSGPAIALALLVGLAACLTLAPALLVLLGRAVFWPLGAGKRVESEDSAGEVRSDSRYFGWMWERLADAILARPVVILVATFLVMLPAAFYGVRVQGRTSYDLLSELDPGRASVFGTKLFRQHFYAGEIGPLTVLAKRDDDRFATDEGRNSIALLTKRLYDLEGVASVRSRAEPTGDEPGSFRIFRRDSFLALASESSPLTKAHFVSEEPGLEGQVARLDLVLKQNPFSAQAMGELAKIRQSLDELTATDEAWRDVEFFTTGVTPGIADLKAVTQRDRLRIQILTSAGVLVVLLLILKRPVVCLYLVFTVVWSYLVTLGITEWVFASIYGPTFQGLSWKTPIFLFVLLVAIGEDYNIYLATRVFEEQARRGRRAGLRAAIIRTGGIITSCGLIMAGTFCAMMTGTLRGMVELGFALSLGVLLDTFVVRPILVPAFLALGAGEEPACREDRANASD